MIIDERTYTLHSGKVPEYLKIVESQLLPLQRVMLGGFMGYFHTEVGTLNQVAHLWAYDDMAERERRRARLASHPDWPSRTALVRPLIVTQRNRILVAAAFSPMVHLYNEQRQPVADLPS